MSGHWTGHSLTDTALKSLKVRGMGWRGSSDQGQSREQRALPAGESRQRQGGKSRLAEPGGWIYIPEMLDKCYVLIELMRPEHCASSKMPETARPPSLEKFWTGLEVMQKGERSREKKAERGTEGDRGTESGREEVRSREIEIEIGRERKREKERQKKTGRERQRGAGQCSYTQPAPPS